jgi:NAD(P)-dependent dehydrogenase (short-subunit alcohol dehydrogenase family)
MSGPSDDLNFAGRAVIVTGGGGALGAAYAKLFARSGAMVLVNDLGTSLSADGASRGPAQSIVDDIVAAGGRAVANFDSVADGAAIVDACIAAFGRVDVVVNNAGVLRDTAFHKMTSQQWKLVHDVHLRGAYEVTRAAWPLFRKQKFGRVVMTASAAGLYGNYGQANYAAAKLGLVGFSNSLAVEGKRFNVHCNTIAPIAGSRMTATVMPPDVVAALKADHVAPLVAFLCHESTDVTGGTFEVGAGWIAALRWQRTLGKAFDVSKGLISSADVAKHWDSIVDFKDADNPDSVMDTTTRVMAALNELEESSAANAIASLPSKL